VNFASLARQAAGRILAGGVAAVIAIGITGMAVERVRFGPTDEDAFARVEREVQSRFEQIALSLRDVARILAAHPDRLAAAAGDRDAASALFDAAASAVQRQREADLAVTVYSAGGIPLAWSGSPSELRRERLDGPAALFVAPGPLGWSLVYVEPAADARGRRLGTIASERLISRRARVGDRTPSTFTLAEPLAPVSLRTRYEGAGDRPAPRSFLLRSPQGDPLLEGSVAISTLHAARMRWRRQVWGILLLILAATLLLLIGPVLDWRDRNRTSLGYVKHTATVVALLLGAWAMAMVGVRSEWTAAPFLTTPGVNPPLAWLLTTPGDFLLTGFLAVALVTVALDLGERWRRQVRHARRAPDTPALRARFALQQSAAATIVVFSLVTYQLFLSRAFAGSALDILHFSIHPWNPGRMALAFGLVVFHASVLWADFLVLRLALSAWRVARRPNRTSLLIFVAWMLPLAVVYAVGRWGTWPVPWRPTVLAYLSVVVAVYVAPRIISRYRHASQAFRLILAFVALLVPAFVVYPSLVHFADRAKRQLVETQYGPEVINQRDEIKRRLERSKTQIDQIPDLGDLVVAAKPNPATPAPTGPAFAVWAQTDLATYRVASAVELYGPDGIMVSRFALNLPEYTSATPAYVSETGCSWDEYEEVSRFGADERRFLHAGRGICRPSAGARGEAAVSGAQGEMVGSIVIHVMPDYNSLPFISSQIPYFELFRQNETARTEGATGSDVEFMVYGWGRVPVYTSGQVAWPLDEVVFNRVYADTSRTPFWTTVMATDREYNLFFLNDRAGIYILGYPTITPIGHLINLAELATLVAALYVIMLATSALFRFLTGRRPAQGRALLREIRASFYRKLFLAFVTVAVAPVLTLALLTRVYIESRLLNDVRSAAVKTSAVAQRVIEDYRDVRDRQDSGALAASPGTIRLDTLSRLDDDIMVWISRVIDQDVNIFETATLFATSERDLFESGLLPTRVPADVYRAVVLDRLPSYVSQEQAGNDRYLLAAAPVRAGGRDDVLTVPLTLRQQEIEREIDDLNRRIVLAASLFILIGAAIGYVMAERIGDPVNRLTRATQRIARGELDARITTTSSDELRRLVEAFNSMAAELERQRGQLERTHRLEAWAEMARQVAHEIKNPLTPIQLSAEHLRRVHGDRGRPLTPVLDECIDSILTQVRLLRQIAGEFSSFASSPVPRPTRTSVRELVEEVVQPYRSGLAGRVEIVLDVPDDLPALVIDRTLIGRALTNMVENALHAMPADGRLTVTGRASEVGGSRFVTISLADTGIGMDREALERLFEPYFSTKAVGTGLGLAIAKRNVELNGGTIGVESQKGRGTTVTVTLPVAPA
jgi:signal transduction histidine kinase